MADQTPIKIEGGRIKRFTTADKIPSDNLPPSGGNPEWVNVQNKPATFPPSAHNHDGSYEPSNANIQAHVTSSHAPSTAQKNSDITKAEIEAKLTGEITTHTHAGGGAVDIKQTEVDFGSVPIKSKRFTITDGAVTGSNQILASLAYDDPSDGETDSAEWFEDLTVMAKAGTGQFFLYCSSLFSDTNGKVKINYIIGSLVFVILHYISFLCLLKDT